MLIRVFKIIIKSQVGEFDQGWLGHKAQTCFLTMKMCIYTLKWSPQSPDLNPNNLRTWWNGKFTSYSQWICSNYEMLSCQYGPKYLRNVWIYAMPSEVYLYKVAGESVLRKKPPISFTWLRSYPKERKERHASHFPMSSEQETGGVAHKETGIQTLCADCQALAQLSSLALIHCH